MFRRLSVKSKLLATVLGVSIASILIVGVISFTQGQDAISDAVLENLTAQRESRAELIERYIRGIENQAATLSQDQSIITAAAEFSVAAAQLADVESDPAWAESAESFYGAFVANLPQSDRSFGITTDRYAPRDPVSQYLQHHYVVGNRDQTRRDLDNADDGSFYSRVHERFHPSLRTIANRFGYYDIFLVDPTENRVVYSVEKEVDFGTSLSSGPWGRTSLANLVKDVQQNPATGTASFVDYDFYRPSLDRPAAFVAAPIFNPIDQQLVGILAFQMPLDEIDDTMTSGGDWETAGFGQTGEAYLVGRDEAMRSQSRLLATDPEAFRTSVVGAGTSSSTVDSIMAEAAPNTVLRQPVRTAAAQNGLKGQTGTAVVTSYHGGVTLSSYSPLQLPDGLEWAIVTEQALSEAEQPVNDLQRSLLVATGLIVLLLTGMAMILSGRFVRPINALIGWTERISDGELDEPVPVTRRDEIGQLASSVDKMVDDMRAQSATIEAQKAQMQSLILNLMPAKVAERVTRGDENVVDAYPNVAMVVAHLSGFSAYARSASPGEAKGVLDEIIGSFDEVASDVGVEKVRGGSWGYMAACGLLEPRLDQKQRAMQFAVAIDQKLEALSNMNSWDLGLRVGVATGNVEAGILGTERISFEVWGDPVSDATALSELAELGSVLVSQDIAKSLDERFTFAELDHIEADGKTIRPHLWVEDA